jgi:hypothetical protein
VNALASPIADQRTNLDRLTAVGGIYHLLTLALFTNPATPNADSVLTDFTLATFDGSAPVAAIAFGASGIEPDGSVHSFAPSVPFDVTGATVLTEVVYGWVLLSADLATYHGGGKLDTPVPMARIGALVVIQPELIWGG